MLSISWFNMVGGSATQSFIHSPLPSGRREGIKRKKKIVTKIEKSKRIIVMTTYMYVYKLSLHMVS